MIFSGHYRQEATWCKQKEGIGCGGSPSLGFARERDFPDPFRAHLMYQNMAKRTRIKLTNVIYTCHHQKLWVPGSGLQVRLPAQLPSQSSEWESAVPPTKTHMVGYSQSRGREFTVLAIKCINTHSPVCI